MAEFFKLPVDERLEALLQAADASGCPPHLLEKDVWVVWSLRHLFAAPYAPHLVFKGGTSLSKAYGVIPRLAELDALTATADERDFETVAQHVREAIERNQPEAAPDRLHTFVIKYLRTVCAHRGVEINRDKALHSIFGEYVKGLRDAGLLESLMTERILKSSISVLEAFNDVRNNKSLAHDNPILNYEESLLIFNHGASSVRFIKSLEAKAKPMMPPKPETEFGDDLPF